MAGSARVSTVPEDGTQCHRHGETICISSPAPGRGSRPLPGLQDGSADDHVDFYRCVFRELVDAQGCSGVAAGVAQNFLQ